MTRLATWLITLVWSALWHAGTAVERWRGGGDE